MADKTTPTDAERQAYYDAQTANDPIISAEAYKTRSRRSALVGGVAALAGFGGWRWIQGQPEVDNIPQVLRNTHKFNEALWGNLHRDNHLAPTFAAPDSTPIRVNGRRGMEEEEIDLDAWRLRVIGPDGNQIGEHVMTDIEALPKVEWTVEHKCVEGWSHVITWGGTAFSNFAALYADQIGGSTDFVNFNTPDMGYPVSLDWASMMHPQTVLAYELNNERLNFDHGAPVRLATPLKYGIKQIKRIGTIEFSNTRGDDFWETRGYDWYSHL